MGNAIVQSATIQLKDQGGGVFGSVAVSSGLVITDIGSNQFRITGSGFGTKPIGETSKVMWDADLGVDGFHATLSRDQAWDSAALGEVSSVQVSAGATQSVRLDHGATSGAILAEQSMKTTGTAPDKILMYRHRYDDFSMGLDWVVRTRIDALVSSLPTVGQTVTGTTSGATAIVQSVTDDGGGDYTIYYDSVGGTVNTEGGAKFSTLEQQTWSGGSATNREGSGMLIGFNNKIARFWDDRGGANQHNTYFSESSNGPDSPALQGRKQNVVEQVSGNPTLNDNGPVLQKDAANIWVNDLFFVQNSDVDVANGKTVWWKQGQKSFESDNRITRDSTNSGKLHEVVQHQVSNGAQPNSYSYYSEVVIDDSWYFVLAWNTARTEFQLLPVASWSDTEIVVQDFGRTVWNELDIHIDSLTPTFNGAHP